jgi:hypothetical protein
MPQSLAGAYSILIMFLNKVRAALVAAFLLVAEHVD